MPPKDETLYIEEMVQAIDNIAAYTEEGGEAFLSSRLIQDAVAKNLRVLGEAAEGLSRESKDMAPEVPWRLVARLPRWLSHAYFRADLRIVWHTVVNDLPAMRDPIAGLHPERRSALER